MQNYFFLKTTGRIISILFISYFIANVFQMHWGHGNEPPEMMVAVIYCLAATYLLFALNNPVSHRLHIEFVIVIFIVHSAVAPLLFLVWPDTIAPAWRDLLIFPTLVLAVTWFRYRKVLFNQIEKTNKTNPAATKRFIVLGRLFALCCIVYFWGALSNLFGLVPDPDSAIGKLVR